MLSDETGKYIHVDEFDAAVEKVRETTRGKSSDIVTGRHEEGIQEHT